MGIELNHKPKQQVKKGDPSVAVRIESPNYETPKLFGRHFTEQDEIVSHVSYSNYSNLRRFQEHRLTF